MGDPIVTDKYGVCATKVAVWVPDCVPDVLMSALVGVVDTLNVVPPPAKLVMLRTKYVVPAVNPVGNAPVVVNTTVVSVGGAYVTVTTAGLAIVIVAVDEFV
jgi:hypothetical protein